VELRVGGQTYRVVATDDDQNVQRLAELVDRKYLEVVPTRGITPQQGIFLTAMALADEARVLAEAAKALTEEVEEQRSRAARLEGERDRSTHLATRAREAVARLLQKVDGVLGAAAGVAAPQDAARAASPAAEDPRSVGATTGSPPPSHDLRQSGPRSGARSSAPPVPPPANDLPPRLAGGRPGRRVGRAPVRAAPGSPGAAASRGPAIAPPRRPPPAAPDRFELGPGHTREARPR
jgi:cell division protein ZapA